MADASRSDLTSLNTAEVAAKLRLSVTRLARQLRQSADPELTPTQASILATVAQHGPLTLGELAEREHVAAPTITKAIGLLHDKGLVTRTTDPEDRRFVLVTLSDDGVALMRRNRARKDAWLAGRLRELEPADLAAIVAAVDALERLSTRKPAR